MGKSGNRLVEFKQFAVRDERCAMKVGTDALLLGAWSDVEDAQQIVDIGTGSGIVALMAAQRALRAQVLGIELEPYAADQALENFEASPFASRMQLARMSAQEFASHESNQGSFDVVLSNPPFFRNKPKSPHKERNLARHDDTLPLLELLEVAHVLLKLGGEFQLVWPHDRWNELQEFALRQGFHLIQVTWVSGAIHRPKTRTLSRWVKGETRLQNDLGISPMANEIHIEEGLRQDGSPRLSEAYVNLLKPYRDL